MEKLKAESPFGSLDEVCDFITTKNHTLKDNFLSLMQRAAAVQDGRIFLGVTTGKHDPLKVISPEQYTGGYLFILNARLHDSIKNNTQVKSSLFYLQTFITRFSPAAIVPFHEEVSALCRHMLAYLKAYTDGHNIVISLFTQLIQKYAPPTVFTTIHPLYTRAILTSGQYAEARTVLLTPITEFDTSKYPFNYRDYLSYYYFGGVILGLIREFGAAVNYLEMVLCAPTQKVSAIQADAYRKWVLIQLLHTGKSKKLPDCSSALVAHTVSAIGTAYAEFAGAFSSLAKADVLKLASTHARTFERDNNSGLVDLCLQSFNLRAIQNLSQVYASLSVDDIAEELEEADIESVRAGIREYIAQGRINADLINDESFLVFKDTPIASSIPELKTQIQRATEIRLLLELQEKTVESSEDYLKKLKAGQSTAQQIQQSEFPTGDASPLLPPNNVYI